MKHLSLLLLAGFCLGMDCEGQVPIGSEAPLFIDTDGDGLSDDEEALLMTSPSKPDTDGDGLSDFDEVRIHGTNPNFGDSDVDSLSDGDEILIHGTDPLNSDTDFDGLSDALELTDFFGSDPLDPDTDSDGILDGVESDLPLDMLIPNPVGEVVEVLCVDYIVVATPNVVGVYAVSDLFSNFVHGFLAGDSVALQPEPFVSGDATGSVRVNLRTLESGFANWLGKLSTNNRGFIVGVVPAGSSIRIILDNGAGFMVLSRDVNETADWFLGDEVQVILPRDPSNPILLPKLLNLDACEFVDGVG